jgi:hypothetical protein
MKKCGCNKKQTKKSKKRKNTAKKRKYKSRNQIWDKAATVIVGAAKSAGKTIKTSLEQSAERSRTREQNHQRLVDFARKWHLRLDPNVPGRFWVDDYHYIDVNLNDPMSVEAAEKQLVGRIRVGYSPRISSSYRGSVVYPRSETHLWDF